MFKPAQHTSVMIFKFTTLWSSTLSEYNSPYYLYCADGSMSILSPSAVALNGLNNIRTKVFFINSI